VDGCSELTGVFVGSVLFIQEQWVRRFGGRVPCGFQVLVGAAVCVQRDGTNAAELIVPSVEWWRSLFLQGDNATPIVLRLEKSVLW